jgi:predicted DNA-binding transcriptional regulator AlpA
MTPSKISETEPPRKSPRLLSYADLRERKGIKFSRQWLRVLIQAGKFPKPIHSGAATTDFLESEVDAYIDGLVKARDEAAQPPAPSG